MVRKVILDMDPGIDDALAIILAFRSPELKVEAITTVAGNVEVEKTSRNALKILEMLGEEGVPVVKGSPKPLARELVTAPYIHGEDGLGNSNLPEPKTAPLKEHAVDVIIDRVMSSKEKEMTIVTTGPLTNVATALMREPLIARRVAGIITMGGAFGVTEYGVGNITPIAEYNVYADPEAAAIVFGSGFPVVAVGLDVTMDPRAMITREGLERIKSIKTRTAEFAAKAIGFVMEAIGVMPLHDPMAVAIAADPSLVVTEECLVWVETKGEYTRGQTIVDRRRHVCEKESWEGRGGSRISICKSVDSGRFLDLFMERVIYRD